MAANQHTTLKLLGVTSLGSTVGTDYYEQIRIGNGTPAHTGASDELYVKGDAEILGKLWLTGSYMENDAAFFWTCPTNTATAWCVGTDGEAYITCDTTTGSTLVDIEPKLQTSVTGWYNEGGGTGTTRQPERYKIALTASDAAGGILNFVNPWGVECLANITVNMKVKTTGACSVDVGVAATGVSDDSLIAGLDIGTATGVFSNVGEKIDVGDGKGSSTAAEVNVILGAVQYVTISMKTGAAAGLTGDALIYLEPT